MAFFYILPLIIFSINYNQEVSVILEDPLRSPVTFTVENGYGLAMDEWPDAILSISYNDISKKLTYKDECFLFVFGQKTTITITYYHRVLFHIFKLPTTTSSMNAELYFSTYDEPTVYSTENPTKIDYYLTVFGKYNVSTSFHTLNTVTVKYDEDGNLKSQVFTSNDNQRFESTTPIQNTFAVTGNREFHLYGINAYVSTKFEPTIKGYIGVSLPITTTDKNRAYRDKIRNQDNPYFEIVNINPRSIPTFSLDVSSLENEGYSFKYCLSENCTNYYPISGSISLEYAISYDVYITASSPNYPQCNNARLKSYMFFINNGELQKNRLPDECLPPKAKLNVTNNLKYMLSSVLINVTLYSWQNIKNGDTFTKESDVDFTCIIQVTIVDYCNQQIYKTVDVKVGEYKEIIVNDDDLPPMCRVSNITTMCYCEDDNFEECAKGVDGRILVNYRGDYYNKIGDPGENISIRIFRNLTIDSTKMINHHNITISANHYLELEKSENITETDDLLIIIDNLTFDPNCINNLIITNSYNLNIRPPTQVTFNPIIINLINSLIIRVPEESIQNAKFSPLKIIGYGKVNVHDYPVDKIEIDEGIKIIKGVYIICNPAADSSICPTKEYNQYKILKQSISFDDYEPESIVYIFHETLNEIINISIKKLNNQSITFVKNPTNSKIILDDNEIKIRILSAEQLFHDIYVLRVGDDQIRYTIQDEDDFTKFIFSYDDVLTLKQGSSIRSITDPFILEPTKDKSIIYLDESFQYRDQLYSVRTPNNKKVNIYTGDQQLSKYDAKYFIRCNEDRCSENDFNLFEGKPPDSIDDVPIGGDDDGKENKNGNGLGAGGIAGIVIAVIVVIAAIVIAVIFYLKKKKQKEVSSNEAQSEA